MKSFISCRTTFSKLVNWHNLQHFSAKLSPITLVLLLCKCYKCQIMIQTTPLTAWQGRVWAISDDLTYWHWLETVALTNQVMALPPSHTAWFLFIKLSHTADMWHNHVIWANITNISQTSLTFNVSICLVNTITFTIKV